MGFQANSYKDATEQTYVQLNSATQVAIILQILLNLLEKWNSPFLHSQITHPGGL